MTQPRLDDYNALCDVCGFKMKASMLRKRWDGFMVCDKDWEPRNILDFYKTRNDAHLLPFTRPDDAGETTWTPTVSGITGTYTINSNYTYDATTKLVAYSIQITPTTTMSFSSVTLSIPSSYTLAVDKKGTTIGSKSGKLYGSAVISGSNILPANVSSTSESILIRGSFTAN